jgi:hypothetical protein
MRAVSIPKYHKIQCPYRRCHCTKNTTGYLCKKYT